MGSSKLNKIPSNDTTGTMELLLRGEFDGYTIFEWDANNLPIYRGRNIDFNADGSETNWQITKFTWAGNNPTDIQITTGVWDARAALSW